MFRTAQKENNLQMPKWLLSENGRKEEGDGSIQSCKELYFSSIIFIDRIICCLHFKNGATHTYVILSHSHALSNVRVSIFKVCERVEV